MCNIQGPDVAGQVQPGAKVRRRRVGVAAPHRDQRQVVGGISLPSMVFAKFHQRIEDKVERRTMGG